MQPRAISGLDFAFPGSVKKLMPKWSDIPDEMKHGRNKWTQLFNDAFFSGIRNIKRTPKPGIDDGVAWRHAISIMRSFEPKHEHKEAAVAYLLSLWYDDITYEVAK